MRHAVEIGRYDAAVDVLAHRHRQLRLRPHEFLRLDIFPQPDDLALAVRHLNAYGRFPGHALDQNALSLQRQAKVIGEVGDAAVLDSSIRLELEGGDHGTGIDLRDLSVHFKLGILFGKHLRQQFQFVGIHGLLLVRTLQQTARGQLVAACDSRHRGLCLVVAVGSLRHFRVNRRFNCGQRLGQNSAGRRRRILRDFGLQHAFDSGTARFRRNSGLHGWLGSCLA